MDDMTCGTCGKTWDSGKIPTPAARCPYEYDHEVEVEPEPPRWEVFIFTEWVDITVYPYAYSKGEAVDIAESLIEDSLGLDNGHMSKVLYSYEVRPMQDSIN